MLILDFDKIKLVQFILVQCIIIHCKQGFISLIETGYDSKPGKQFAVLHKGGLVTQGNSWQVSSGNHGNADCSISSESGNRVCLYACVCVLGYQGWWGSGLSECWTIVRQTATLSKLPVCICFLNNSVRPETTQSEKTNEGHIFGIILIKPWMMNTSYHVSWTNESAILKQPSRCMLLRICLCKEFESFASASDINSA